MINRLALACAFCATIPASALAVARKDEDEAKARHNADVLLRLRGMPMQPGTPETDADPRNPQPKA